MAAGNTSSPSAGADSLCPKLWQSYSGRCWSHGGGLALWYRESQGLVIFVVVVAVGVPEVGLQSDTAPALLGALQGGVLDSVFI